MRPHSGFLREFVRDVVGAPLQQDDIFAGRHEQTYRRLRGVLNGSRACRDLFQALYAIPAADLPRISAPVACDGDGCASSARDCCDDFAYCPCSTTASGAAPLSELGPPALAYGDPG